ncbi:hypothetical protein D3C81_1848120 [compost metagenome]
MKFRILVKQAPGALVPVYYPQFKIWFWKWMYYDKPATEQSLKHCGFMFRIDAERFLQQRFKTWQAETCKPTIIPWNPYQ